MTRHFITVEWCGNGFRGLLSRKDGQAAARDEPWTQDEMDDFLGPFTLILSPQSQAMTEANVSRHSFFFPLAEYSHEWGIALTEKDGLAWCAAVKKLVKEVNDE